MFSFHKGNLYQKCVELRLTCWTALTESFLKRHRGTVFILIAYWELKSSMCVCKLNWNRRKGFNIQIITHLPLCNHVQGWYQYTHNSPFPKEFGWLPQHIPHQRQWYLAKEKSFITTEPPWLCVNLTLVVGPSSFSATQLWRLKDRSLQLTKTLFPNFSSNCFTSGSMPDKSSLYKPKHTHTHSSKPVAHPVI